MATIDLARRAEIGREKRARTRAQIVEAGALLLSERPLDALTIDAVVEASGVAKGTFYYHFQSIDELAAAVGAMLGQTFDELLEPARLKLRDPIARLSFAFTQFLEKAITEPAWARLVIQSSQSPSEPFGGVRANLKMDLAKAIAEGRLSVRDVELAADIVMGVWLQVTRGSLERRPPANLPSQALEAVLRGLGVSRSRKPKSC